MSKYVVSDLHGCYDDFIKMLKLINFNDSDELYILGDVIDRGTNSLKIIDYIVCKPNIILLKGNHEQMYIEWFETGDSYNWFCNGGKETFDELLERPIDFQYTLYKYFKKLPLIKVVDKFILVHAGLTLPRRCDMFELDELLDFQREKDNLWTRKYLRSNLKYKDYTIICGHTPVISLITDIRNSDDVKFVHRPGHIFIDCGCTYKKYAGRLGCLRLDDMEEFYV